ncbi:MAG: pyruvate kinase [Gammaproteobacteria bacterium]|nr:pyruvate kinase [Gammaproteobacteria bacterium]MDE0650593.1 pyruvate kinase [Gammaproteobacteria bacterium]MXW09897.1 pyruvate kinase [Gammaproteobacteria bacterium]MYC50970.1 pyruvate kinase [Gammaproteobacteria bacterium]
MLRTKLVCTMGPATFSAGVVRDLVDSGMTMARLNMSHGLREDHLEAVALIRRAAEEAGTPVSILVDLGGPKIRVGRLESPLFLAEGQEVVIAPEETVEAGEIPTTYRHLADDVVVGDRVLLDDGLLEMRCVGKDGGKARFLVETGGQLKSFKGMNVPGANLSTPSLTDRDLEDLDFALEAGVEYVGLSFVRGGADIEELKERVAGRALVVAKVELVRALASIEEIVKATDAVMVARGDLGVEVPFEQVPLAQKRIVQLANYSGRPVIIATQMLDSMIQSPRPTRAEASDVANAVLDGTDAVMLSGETAVGEYPLHAARAMVRIIREIEGSGVLAQGPRYLPRPDNWQRGGATRREHAVASCTVDAVRQLDAPALVVITSSGFSARLVSSYRPPVPIFAVCTEPRTFRQLAPVWGVWPTLAADVPVSYSALSAYGKEAVVRAGVGKPGDSVVVTAGYPFHESGSTNTMLVEQL